MVLPALPTSSTSSDGAKSAAATPDSAQPRSSHPPHSATGAHPLTAKLVLLATGVVFGDIGTSPLYALKECVDPEHGAAATRENLFGVLSLIFWSLTMVVTVKYLTFIMKADNRGEGGILALLALAPQDKRKNSARIGWIAGLVIFGAALLYGDGVITPAISVLSAVEGLGVATTRLTPAIVPLTVMILIGLFWVQKRGTASIGNIFGPIMIVWFATLAVLGAQQIATYPAIFGALHPMHALAFFARHGWHGFAVLGSVVLVITGGEALYADMGHFGPRPIRVAWFALVMPALLINYFGQAAAVIRHPEFATNPFYAVVPPVLLYPMVVLSTAATIIASQALISGAYSLTRQAVQLGFCPRVTILHTSESAEGQIYIPEVNTALAIACVWLVLSFKESSALAAAYGIAVTGTMSITSIVYFVVIRRTWHWPLWRAVPLVAMFLSFDIPFFAANALKFFNGGWFPIAVSLADVAAHKPHRVAGTAVFMSSNPTGVPIVLLHHWKHNRVLHETIVLLNVVSESVPDVRSKDKVTSVALGHGF